MTELTELLKQVKNLDIKTKNLVEGMESGAYRSRFRGGGIEFSEVENMLLVMMQEELIGMFQHDTMIFCKRVC